LPSANVDTGGLRITIKGLTRRFIGIIGRDLMFHVLENGDFFIKGGKIWRIQG
jgi:hypothetical protein